MTLKEWEKNYCRDCNIIVERCYFCWEEYRKIKAQEEDKNE